MFRSLFTDFNKKPQILAIFLLLVNYTGIAQLPDYVSSYDCLRNTVSHTMEIDSDSNYVFDTYGIRLCDDSEIQTFPLSAIGDISRWPPLEGPTRSIVFDNLGSVSLLETFYDNSGSVIAWFQKSADNDTVYFHSNDEMYDPINFSYDSSASYIQAFPNPADYILNIHYVVTEANDIEIQLLSYEGDFLAQILNTPAGQGEYKLVFPVNNFANGYYRIRFISGSHVYSFAIAIVH